MIDNGICRIKELCSIILIRRVIVDNGDGNSRSTYTYTLNIIKFMHNLRL